jgi:AcrR family transcriptional regulator
VTAALTARERRRERSRQAILDAALALIESSGVDGWSMRELATQVDYSPGALYRYFDGKALVLAALCTDAMTGLQKHLAATEATGGPLTRLEELGLAYLAYAAEQPTLFRLALVELPSKRRDLVQQPDPASPYGLVLAAVRDAIAEGALHATQTFGAEQIAFTIWATVHGMAVLEQTHLRGFGADFALVHREALRRLVTGLAVGQR